MLSRKAILMTVFIILMVTFWACVPISDPNPQVIDAGGKKVTQIMGTSW